MKIFTAIISAALVSGVAAAQPAELEVRLACAGNIERKAGLFDPDRQNKQSAEQLDIEIANGRARARLPRKIRPAGMGDEGWAEIKKLQVSDDAVSGSVYLNFMTQPKLRLDRRTGFVSLEGTIGNFSGTCKPIGAGERAF